MAAVFMAPVDPAFKLFMAILIGVCVLLAIVAVAAASRAWSSNREGTLTVTLYANDGTVIKTWTSVKDADACWDNSRVAFTHPLDGTKVVIKGTIVVEDAEFNWERPLHIESKVTLYGASNQPIKTWCAADVDPAWANDRTVFCDTKNGNRITVFGTTLIEHLKTPISINAQSDPAKT